MAREKGEGEKEKKKKKEAQSIGPTHHPVSLQATRVPASCASSESSIFEVEAAKTKYAVPGAAAACSARISVGRPPSLAVPS